MGVRWEKARDFGSELRDVLDGVFWIADDVSGFDVYGIDVGEVQHHVFDRQPPTLAARRRLPESGGKLSHRWA